MKEKKKILLHANQAKVTEISTQTGSGILTNG